MKIRLGTFALTEAQAAGIAAAAERHCYESVHVYPAARQQDLVRQYLKGLVEAAIEEQRCRKCGCTYSMPCDGGCEWTEEDLCSACVEEPS